MDTSHRSRPYLDASSLKYLDPLVRRQPQRTARRETQPEEQASYISPGRLSTGPAGPLSEGPVLFVSLSEPSGSFRKRPTIVGGAAQLDAALALRDDGVIE